MKRPFQRVMQSRHRLKLSLATTLCFAALGAVSNAAADSGTPPPTVPDDVAAAAQYRESVPTASGKVPTESVMPTHSSNATSGAPDSAQGTLAPPTRAAIRAKGGRDKKLLAIVGRSSGAAVRDLTPAASASGTVHEPDAFGAAAGTLRTNFGLVALVIVLVGATLVAGVARRRPA
jgi:hypothetical protein